LNAFHCNKYFTLLQMATVWTLKRIADYIKHGPGVWYTTLENGAIVFHDSEEDSVCGHGSVRNMRYIIFH
jgi:hypothetical protein